MHQVRGLCPPTGQHFQYHWNELCSPMFTKHSILRLREFEIEDGTRRSARGVINVKKVATSESSSAATTGLNVSQGIFNGQGDPCIRGHNKTTSVTSERATQGAMGPSAGSTPVKRGSRTDCCCQGESGGGCRGIDGSDNRYRFAQIPIHAREA